MDFVTITSRVLPQMLHGFCYYVACVTQRRHIGITICRLASPSQNNFCHIFLRNHTGQLLDIWHRASVWRTVSCKTVSNLPHVHFLFDGTYNIFDIEKMFVTFFSGTTQASFLIFGTEHQYGALYRVRQFWICRMSTSCLTELRIFLISKNVSSHFSQEPHRPASWYLAQSISMENCIV